MSSLIRSTQAGLRKLQKKSYPATYSRILFFVIAAIIVFSIVIILHQIGFMGHLNLLLTDNLYGGKSPLNSIIIIGIDDLSIQQIGRWPWDRSILADLTAKLGSPRIIGYDIGFYEPSTGDDILSASFAGKKIVLASQVSTFTPDGRADQILLPISRLLSDGITTGYVNILTHPDGITRTVNLNLSSTYSHFAYEIFYRTFGQPLLLLPNYYINFPSPPYTFHMISAAKVLDNKIEPSAFDDKIVLIGATSPSLKDHYFVPTSSGHAMPGVEVHASIIQTLLNQNNLLHQSRTSLYLTILFFIVLIGASVIFLRPLFSLLLLLFLIIAYELIAIFSFDYRLLLNVVYPPLAMLLSYPLFYALSYALEQRERKKIEHAFGKYLSPHIVSHLLKNKDQIQLGGEERELTIFFSDIRGFTTISEKLAPVDLVSTLNSYFNSMSLVIVKHNGIVDKYIGDAIMAFWGAPHTNPSHAADAARSAIEMKRTLRRLQPELLSKGVDINIGIGINTGLAVVGNIGSEDRFDYTVIGDSVNLASRVEGLTKLYGVFIIITAHTKRHITSSGTDLALVTRELDLVSVKGKSEPVAIFELIDYSDNIEPDTHEFISIYEQALSLYRRSNFTAARQKFKDSFAMKRDIASQLMITRCDNYIKNPPLNWNGVYVASTK